MEGTMERLEAEQREIDLVQIVKGCMATFLDFPTAWAIQRQYGTSLTHAPKCSSVPATGTIAGPGFLCDCGAVEKDWEARRALALDAIKTWWEWAGVGR